MQTSILSPGSIRLTTTVSIPAEPVPETAQGHPIRRLKDVSQQFLGLIHQGHELGVQVANQGHPHRRQDAGMHVAGGRGPISSRGDGLRGRGIGGRGTADTVFLLSRR